MKLLPRDLLELRHIADRLACDISMATDRTTTDFLISSHSVVRLVELFDKVAKTDRQQDFELTINTPRLTF